MQEIFESVDIDPEIHLLYTELSLIISKSVRIEKSSCLLKLEKRESDIVKVFDEIIDKRAVS